MDGGGEGGGKGTQPANGVADDLLVEYAKSSRSKCKNCKEQIDKVRFDLWFDTFITMFQPTGCEIKMGESFTC